MTITSLPDSTPIVKRVCYTCANAANGRVTDPFDTPRLDGQPVREMMVSPSRKRRCSECRTKVRRYMEIVIPTDEPTVNYTTDPIRMQPRITPQGVRIAIVMGAIELEVCDVAIAHERVTYHRQQQAQAVRDTYVLTSATKRDRAITYDPTIGMFRLSLDGRPVGVAGSYLAGEQALNEIERETPPEVSDPPCDPACEIDGYCRVCDPFAVDPDRPDPLADEAALFPARLRAERGAAC